MLRTILPCTLVAALVLAVSSVASAAPPAGFTAPATLGTKLQVSSVVAAADAAGGPGGAVAVRGRAAGRGASAAFSSRSGGVGPPRVGAGGSLGAPLPAASRHPDARHTTVAV